MVTQAQMDHERRLATYDQNSETFRSLNQLMWQIPLIGMTLTGGLWFGVAKVDGSPFFQFGLLALAGIGNLVLVAVLGRLRYIMGQYLDWLEHFDSDGFVAAGGVSIWTRPRLVRTLFQMMLCLAALISGGLMVSTARQANWIGAGAGASSKSVAFYDRAARDLADSYESISFEQTHPDLAKMLNTGAPQRILDVGAGSGRDATAMAALGHTVTAIEPSDEMRKLAQGLHPQAKVNWVNDSLPDLSSLRGHGPQFDLVVVSAIWMHIHPRDRYASLERLAILTKSGGEIYLTLRLGPADPARAIYAVSEDEVRRLATSLHLKATNGGEQPDLLGRPNIRWQTVRLLKD